MKPRILIFAYGNPSRGDDALGPLLLERLEPRLPPPAACPVSLELLTDFQLQIEHTLDIPGREAVVFVDAHASCPPPYRFQTIEPAPTRSYTTHALTPEALLRVFQEVHPATPLPPCYLLGIRGHAFELGASLSDTAETHLQAATDWLKHLLLDTDYRQWPERAQSP
mgnify:CR=1 FL=1